METASSDAETKHYAEIGLTADGVCRKTFVPYEVKADEETRRVQFVISTGAVDRDNDTIKVDGWDVQPYLKNPVVLFAHRSDMLPVAKAISVVKSAGALKATAEFPPKGQYPLADTVYDFLKGGFLRATSVGFRPKKGKFAWNEQRGGIDFEEQELLEFSVVPVPSNPQALMEMSKDFATAGAPDLAAFRKALDLAEQALTKDEAKGGFWSPSMAPGTGDNVDVSKAGRRLSTKTEASLRSARKSVTEAAEHLASVLDVAEEELDDEKAAQPAAVTVPPGPAKAPVFDVDPQKLSAAIAAATAEAARKAVNRLLGRID